MQVNPQGKRSGSTDLRKIAEAALEYEEQQVRWYTEQLAAAAAERDKCRDALAELDRLEAGA